jgi:hypothetical protein
MGCRVCGGRSALDDKAIPSPPSCLLHLILLQWLHEHMVDLILCTSSFREGAEKEGLGD